MRKKPTISITLPKNLHDWISREAEQTNRSRSQMIAAMIDEGVKRREKKSYVTSDTVQENQALYSSGESGKTSYTPSPLEEIIKLARSGVRTLSIDPDNATHENFELVRNSFPDLFKSLTRLALKTEADPSLIQPFDERLWPFSQNELYALRDVYALIWRQQHT
jgi:predicted transcriptional regulator